MRTEEVIKQLLQKFKIENSPRDFALYIIFGTGEQRKLKKTDVPLLQRLLQGPSKSNARIFLMDKDAEEISRDVWAPVVSACLRLRLRLRVSH